MGKHQNRRFGAIAVEKGYITEAQLIEALSIQAKENIEAGTHRLIGQILLSLEYITDAQIDDVFETINLGMVYKLSVAR